MAQGKRYVQGSGKAVRKKIGRMARENAASMRGLEALAAMSDEEAAAYVAGERAREARVLNTSPAPKSSPRSTIPQ